MTTKMKFDTTFDEGLEVVVLRNNRYAYRAECPWVGKGGKTLSAFKFCRKSDLDRYEIWKETSEK